MHCPHVNITSFLHYTYTIKLWAGVYLESLVKDNAVQYRKDQNVKIGGGGSVCGIGIRTCLSSYH
jgi:hypothetical protein